MADYSFLMGVWKSLKNTAIVLAPAFAAAYLAFIANLPVEYQGVAATIGGFLTYLLKNYIQVKSE
jgi:hypothetical protein